MSDNHDLCRHDRRYRCYPRRFQDWTTPLLSYCDHSHDCQVGKNAVCLLHGMTEKQGGSDVMSNTTLRRAPGNGRSGGGAGHGFSAPKAMRIWCWRR
ncbi:hypothetical protein ACNKHX_26685 [Shigella flexneri]